MNYKNGREAKVGDGVVAIVGAGDTAGLSGMVSRVDLAQLQVLTFAERQNGAPYNLIPVTVNGRHFEPISFEVPAELCVHVDQTSFGINADAEKAIGLLKDELARENAENAALRSDRAALEQRLLETGALLGEYQARFGELPTVVPTDTTTAELPGMLAAPVAEAPAPSVAVVPEQPIQPS